jgi:amphi-Trp domain-containing protein
MGNDKETEKEVEKSYSSHEVAAKLRRLAEALEQEKTFEIQIAGERVYIPPYATVEFEYARDGDQEEVEIELKWKRRAR